LEDRLILTYDGDLVLKLDTAEYRDALYVSDVTIPSEVILT
jgi:hypothetical protein